MKKLTQEQINKMLEEHKHWLNEDCEGWETTKVDFSSCDLSHADLRYANLSYINLCDADLRDADLSHVNLSYINLSHADLRYADLSHACLRDACLRGACLRDADLSHACLRGADLHDTDLSHACLRGADLSYANLRGACLRGADLSYINLRHADLYDADLSYADLSHADLSYAEEVPYIPMVCPEEGDFIGWKKAGDKIVKLRIPEDALRSSATTRKCRCNKAEVIEIYNIDGTIADERIVSSDYDSSFTYEVGKTVEVQDFDTNRWDECTRGIHFFINRQEAINYQ